MAGSILFSLLHFRMYLYMQHSNVLLVKNIKPVWIHARLGHVKTEITMRRAPVLLSERSVFVKVIPSCTEQTRPFVSPRTSAVRMPLYIFACMKIKGCCDNGLLFPFDQCVQITMVLHAPRARCGTALCVAAVCSSVWRMVVWFLWNPSAVMNLFRCVRGRESMQSMCWRKESAVLRRFVV